MLRAAILSSVAGLAIVAGHAIADDHDPNLHLIKARKGEMEVRAYSAAPLFDMAKGKVPYDGERAAKLANNLKVLTALDMGAAWPAGTSTDEYPEKTHALPEVWSTWPEIAEHGKEYKTAVDALAASAGNGLDALRSTIGGVGDACKGCHDEFREEE